MSSIEGNYWYTTAKEKIRPAFAQVAKDLSGANLGWLSSSGVFAKAFSRMRREVLSTVRCLADWADTSEDVLLDLADAVQGFLKGELKKDDLKNALSQVDNFLNRPATEDVWSHPRSKEFLLPVWDDGPGSMEGVCGVCAGETLVRFLVDPSVALDPAKVIERHPWCLTCYLERRNPEKKS